MWLRERQPLNPCALLAALMGVCTRPCNYALIYSLGFLHHTVMELPFPPHNAGTGAT